MSDLVPVQKPRVRITTDGYINFASRVGTGSDKSSAGHYWSAFLSQFDLEAAYRSSWLRKIVDIPPFDETREWRTWTGADDKQITLIDDEERRLGLRQKVLEARILARKDGGAAILLGTADMNLQTPLDPENIGQDGLQFITVLSRMDIQPQDEDRDPASPTFGMPRYYLLRNSSGMHVHPSRVVRFIGNPIRQRNYWDGWGESIWVELRDAIRNSDQIAAGIASLVNEAKLDVVKVKGLMANLSTAQGEDRLTTRWAAANNLKSSVNALIIDAEDDYLQKTLTFAGLTDVQASALMIMSGMADIPATRLLGRSPQGMNATGESDMRNYYDRIRAGQTMMLGPTLYPLDEMLIRSALGSRPPEIFYEWNPLYSLSEKEAAEVEKIFAETAEKYATSGLLPDDALTAMVGDGIVERGQWPGAQKAIDEAQKEPSILEEPTEADLAEEEARTALAMATVADPSGNRNPVTDAAPRTLYVRRDVVNKAEITKWARAQGFTDIVPDMHVTIAYSRTPVDWFKVGTSWSEKIEIAKGGPRQLEKLGKNGEYTVLLITASELVWRNEEITRKGASWDWPEYQPHISIQVGGDVDISKMKPYTGRIVLGPEIFEEVRD